MSQRKTAKKFECLHCHRIFETFAPHAKYCPNCKKERDAEQKRRYRATEKGKAQIKSWNERNAEKLREYQRDKRRKKRQVVGIGDFQRAGKNEQGRTLFRIVCQREGCEKTFESLASNAKYCPDCRARVNRQRARDAAKVHRAKEQVRLGGESRTDYCERMHLRNPGSLCGKRDFCRGCKFARKGDHCSDGQFFTWVGSHS